MLGLLGPDLSVAAQDAQACVAIADPGARLACYDALFATAPRGEADQAVIASQNLIPARPGGREPATMTVRCSSGALTVAFGFAGQLVSSTGSSAPVTLQTDLSPARSRLLAAAPDNLSLQIADPVEAAAFLSSLQGWSRLTVRMTPVNQRSVSVNFDLLEAESQLAPVRQACGIN